MTNQQRLKLIQERLTASLTPSHLEVLDESHLHIGHPGAQSGAGHFAVIIQSPKFEGLTKVACHRLIYQALNDLIGPEIHALRIVI